MATVVVGIDGSDNADAAFAFAVDEARLRGATLRIVAVWEVPATFYGGGGGYGGGFEPVDVQVYDGVRGQAQKAAEELVASARARADGVECDPVVEEGDAASVLVEQAEGAALLVVGSRGLGGFKSFLLGSVSQKVLHHAPCPVVIVRAPSSF